MRHLTALFLTLGLAGASAAPAWAEAPSTLPALVRSALATHESVARAESEVRRAHSDVRLTTAALLPRLELNGTYTRFGSAQTVEFAPGETFVITPLTDWNYSVDLRQTLFYGLRDWRARTVARQLEDAAELERLAAAGDLTLQVSQAFYDAVAAAQRQAVRRAAVEQAKAQLQVARRRFEVGEVAAVDVAQLQARAAAERQQAVEAAGAADLARRRLARLAGVHELGELEPPGSIPVPDGDVAGLEAAALERRAELQALDQRLAAAGLVITVEKGAWLPELDVHAQYYAQKAEFPSKDWSSVALTLKVPVYDGGVTAARVAKAREDQVQVELMQREVEKLVRDQVDTAAIGHRTAVAALDAAEERLAAAREAHRQVERAYRVGEATATDLLVATTELTDAETAEIIARWQRELQAIALRRAVGHPPLPDLDLATTTATPAPQGS